MSRSFRKIYNPICSSEGDKWCRSQYHRSSRRKTKRLLQECMLFYSSQDDEIAVSDEIITKGIDYSLHFADKWSWSSDGGNHWRADKNSFYKKFNKTVFGDYDNVHRKDDIWKDYIAYRNCKLNQEPTKWIIYYDKPDKMVTDYWTCWDIDDKKYVTHEDTYMKYIRCSKIVDHRPLESDLPENVVFKGYFRYHKKTSNEYMHYWSDYDLIEFLFHRNLIPATFNSKEELTNWLLKNENRIVNSWYKLHSKK